MKTRTIHSEKIWQSPDGQKTIWEVMLEADGKQYQLKTFSPKISQIGFEGEIESYEKNGDRFVKQISKKQSPENYRDNNSIRAQWAIGQAIALTTALSSGKEVRMPVIEKKAKELYSMVDRVKEDKNDVQQAQDKKQPEQQGTTGSTDPGPTYVSMF